VPQQCAGLSRQKNTHKRSIFSGFSALKIGFLSIYNQNCIYAIETFEKPCIRRQFSIKLPRKRKSLTAQGVFGKIIDTDWGELCFLSM